MDNYKKKYLKYKNKYLDLQKQLVGGAKCPKIGFSQHSGECWHDAYSTIILYSDNISNNIQRVFDSTDTYKFNLEDCINYALTEIPRTLLPINIEEGNLENFLNFSRQYINNLYQRYTNEKLAPVPYRTMPKNITKKQASYYIERQPLPQETKGLPPRRNSINQSLLCTKAIYDITNINLLHKLKFTQSIHGGNDLLDLSSKNLVNFFLLNYYPKTLGFQEKPIYLDFKTYDLLPLLILTFNFIILSQISLIIKFLEDLSQFLNDQSSKIGGILCHLIPQKIHESKLVHQHNYAGHAVSFFTCNGENKFYDDNGADPADDVDEEEEDSVENYILPSQIDNNADDTLNLEIPSPSRSTIKRFINYDWKEYFPRKIKTIIDRLNKIPTLSQDKVVEEYNNSLLSLSDLFTGASGETKCGRKYLKNFILFKLKFVIKNEHNEDKYISDNLSNLYTILYMYSNARVLNLFKTKFTNFEIKNNETLTIALTLLKASIFSNNSELENFLLSESGLKYNNSEYQQIIGKNVIELRKNVILLK
jgi:hypothetical protein